MNARASRRQVLAFIALAAAPAPRAISFSRNGERFRIDVERVDDLPAWGAAFGMSRKDIDQSINNPLHFESEGQPMVAVTLHPAEWRGWRVALDATVDVVDVVVDPLDDTTREQLQAVADGSAAHRQVAGWGGEAGQCGVECACGVTFYNFDTIAEAAALLDGHIAAANAEDGAPC